MTGEFDCGTRILRVYSRAGRPSHSNKSIAEDEMGNTAWDKATPSSESPDSQRSTRRGFLDYLLGTSAVATLGAIVYPIFRFMSPPQVIESAEKTVVAAKLNELPINSGKIFKFGNKPGVLVRTATGEFKAFSAVCTHLECIVQYRADTKQIWCACHNGQYNLGGKNIGGPPPRPLEEFQVNTRGDDVVVTKS